MPARTCVHTARKEGRRSRIVWPWRCWNPLLLILLLAGCEGVQHVLDPASRDARMVAALTWWMIVLGAAVMIVTMSLLLVALLLQRGGERQVSFRASAAVVIVGGVLAPVAAIVALMISGVAIGDETEHERPVTGPTIEAVGKLWWWEFRYLDEAGDVVAVTANELHLPAGERSRIRLISDNVIHSFWVPNLQGKTDMIPGRTNLLFAEPEAAGEWRGQCAEFCGLQHAKMAFIVVAEPRADFDRWLQLQARDAAVTDGPGLDAFLRHGCGDCHTVRGTPAIGEKGPDLTHLASRRTLAAATLPNSRGNLGGWITSTHQVKPGALMPATVPEPDELQALLDFLEALE